uniref:Peptidase_S9 domain-containing protein n=2 Tax=Strongyloides stercoralis TaxID=6248 RepID=A0A0K0EAM0_STRER
MSKKSEKSNLNKRNSLKYEKNVNEMKKEAKSRCKVLKRNSDNIALSKSDHKLKAITKKKLGSKILHRKASSIKEKNCKTSNKQSKDISKSKSKSRSKSKSKKRTKFKSIKGAPLSFWKYLNNPQNHETFDVFLKTTNSERNISTASEKTRKKMASTIKKSQSLSMPITSLKYNKHKQEYLTKFVHDDLITNESDEAFLKNLKTINNDEYFIQCNCVGSESSLKIRIDKSKKLWRNAKNLFKIFFVPEAERNFTEKAIFWPQKSNYYFYQIKNYENKSFNIQHLYLMKKYKLLTENNVINEDTKLKLEEIYSNVITNVTNEDRPKGEYLFGHTHPCYVLTDKIKSFFIKDNQNGDLIPCAYTITGMKTKYTLIYSHPNAYSLEDLIIGYPNIYDIAKFLNVEIIAYEYPGYGICDGKPTEEGLYNRLIAVYNYLIKKKKVLPSEIILLGYSLGGALSIMGAANKRNVGGLILFATPASFKSCIKHKLFCTSSVSDKKKNDNEPFDVASNIQMIRCPTLVIHSKADKIVPISHCNVLLKYLGKKAEYLLLEDVSHNGTERSVEVWLTVKKFLIEGLPRIKKNNLKINTN